jgi:hypothetical protein
MKDGTKNLDKLQKVELRDVWPLEDRNFTPWLAEEENLKLLSETLNLQAALDRRSQAEGHLNPFAG